MGVKFGSLAVLKGCIKQETLEFFLKYFVENHNKVFQDTLCEHLSSIDPDKTEVITFETTSRLRSNQNHPTLGSPHFSHAWFKPRKTN